MATMRGGSPTIIAIEIMGTSTKRGTWIRMEQEQ
jgi:hypothetical protein